MATGGTAEILEKIGERHLECSICYKRFTDPKILNCIHSFCLTCLKYLRESQDPLAVKIQCPLCRRDTELGRNGVEDLPTNFTLSALVEEFAIQEQLLQGQGSEIKCQCCEGKSQAVSFCMDCAHFLCKDCQNVHESLARTKSHQTYMIALLQSGEIAYKSKLREDPKCVQHPYQNLNIYCNTCQQLICTTCSVLKHEKHSCVDISESFDKCKQEIEGLLADAVKKKTELKKTKKNISKAHKKLDTMFEATNKKISQKADKEVARIREMEQKLKQEAKEIYQDRVKTLQTAEDTNNTQLNVAELTLDEMNQLLAQEIKAEILDLKQKLVQYLQGILKEEPIYLPEKLHFIDFHEGDANSLGQLVLEDTWILATELDCGNSRINSVASFSDNDIVTINGRYMHKHLLAYVPTNNPKVPFVSHKLPGKLFDVKHPHKVAVNSVDHLIVLDGPAVKTFSREYQLLHQFQPGTDLYIEPTCLAVDEDNLIAVGFKAREEISLHNSDGTLIRKLPAPMIGDQLAVSNKRLVYVNNTESRLICKDYNGEDLFYEEIRHPRTVCCDIHGNIYVATGEHSLMNRSQTGDIYQLNPEGKNMKCVKTKCNLCPVTMATTPAGNLVVGGTSKLHIYRRI
ncbi:E3 ubiquitin-protein ligase TRIM56-like [Acanthaster planci]|uniref:E3 ubiquitin-protein ligase TRIM56-like n=1 Tax=Acanthaster planci TaxID=133434 RepID=A0A8B7Y0X0_ACAPL|nr:E3 ubiquitin-protein ligase TRIM56-like [Acanthaster planci]